MSEDLNLSENFPKTQEELDRIIQRAQASKLNRIRELEAEVTQLSGARDAAIAQVAERDAQVADLTADLGKKERELLVAKVAHEKKVPARWLTGDSEEELVAAADEWLADASSVAGGSVGAPKETAVEGVQEPEDGVQKRGHVPSAGTGGEKPPRPSYDEVKQKAYEQAKTTR